jgi:hypothetical protein
MANKFARRKDDNHEEIIQFIQGLGRYKDLVIGVKDVHNFSGMLDLQLFIGSLQITLEIKRPEHKAKSNDTLLSDAEKRYHGPFFLVFTKQDILDVITASYDLALAHTQYCYNLTNDKDKEKFAKQYTRREAALKDGKKKQRQSYVRLVFPQTS